jgi:hypothetical protein
LKAISFDPIRKFRLDYLSSKLPITNTISHHRTIISVADGGVVEFMESASDFLPQDVILSLPLCLNIMMVGSSDSSLRYAFASYVSELERLVLIGRESINDLLHSLGDHKSHLLLFCNTILTSHLAEDEDGTIAIAVGKLKYCLMTALDRCQGSN